MIKLEKPKMDQRSILHDCISNMREGDKKLKLNNSKSEIVDTGKRYDVLASKGELQELAAKERSTAGASKEDLLFLYDNKFSKRDQLARKYYDEIMLLAPNGRCPQCGQRQVRTLDHYLPKSKYPLLSVVPVNLIPSCSDCNKDKLVEVPDMRKKETIHPYYDNFEDEIWIKASLIEEDPIGFDFFVCKPDGWSDEKYLRATNHFKVFKLNEVYKPYAAEMFISEMGWILRLYKKCGKEITRQEIRDRMIDEQKIRKNSWKAAVYEAIYYNKWFWNEYIRNYH